MYIDACGLLHQSLKILNVRERLLIMLFDDEEGDF